LWNANTVAESFEIKWKQRNSMKMCVSVSYLLEDESKCTFSMNLTDEDGPYKRVIYSTNIKESVTWFYTCIYKYIIIYDLYNINDQWTIYYL